MPYKRLRPDSIAIILIVVILTALAYFTYRTHASVRQLRWELELARSANMDDLISLDVGTIQFLRRGYSITLNQVNYSAGGVTLVGSIGNPHLLNLSSLTLDFEVHRPKYNFKEEYLRNPFFFFDNRTLVGKAQVLIGDVLAGSSAPFQVFVPNVKQGGEQYDVSVAFSGERYSYVR